VALPALLPAHTNALSPPQTLRKISKFVASQNERIYNTKGLQLIDPTYRGLRVIEITIFDRPGRTWLPLSHSANEFFMWDRAATVASTGMWRRRVRFSNYQAKVSAIRVRFQKYKSI